MNPQHHTEIDFNQHDQWLINHIVTLSNIIDQFFKSLSKYKMNQHLENFYQYHINLINEPIEVLQFKKDVNHLKNERHESLLNKIQLIMTSYFLNNGFDMTRDPLHEDLKQQSLYRSFYDTIENDVNHFIKNTILYVDQWHHHLVRLKPAAFLISDESNHQTYQEVCLTHELLCLSKTQYQKLKYNDKEPLKHIYEQYIKRQLKHQRDIQIWSLHQNHMKHLQTQAVIPFLTYDEMTTGLETSHQDDLMILPIPEDLVEFERWTYKYLKTKSYVLWLKNDALLTHYKSIPKYVEVIIDMNVICQEILNLNPLETLSFHTFQHEVIPLLRDIHQTLRIKKIKHYLYGYALSQNQILHRCLTLGFRHLIIHQLYLYPAIEESLKFIHATDK